MSSVAKPYDWGSNSLEPDEKWRAHLREEIVQELQPLVDEAIKDMQQKLGAPTLNEEERHDIEMNHSSAMLSLRRIAEDMYMEHVQARERRNRPAGSDMQIGGVEKQRAALDAIRSNNEGPTHTRTRTTREGQQERSAGPASSGLSTIATSTVDHAQAADVSSLSRGRMKSYMSSSEGVFYSTPTTETVIPFANRGIGKNETGDRALSRQSGNMPVKDSQHASRDGYRSVRKQYERDGRTPLASNKGSSERSTPHSSLPTELPRGARTRARRGSVNTAQQSIPHANENALDYECIAQECFDSESEFDRQIQCSRNQEGGKALADPVLCAMQKILDRSHPPHVNQDVVQRWRRTMLKFSMECKVIPSCLFQHLVRPSEKEPRGGGSFADIFFGFLDGKAIALKRLRLFQVTDLDLYFKSLCREALLWRQLRHPSVLQFLGLGGTPSRGGAYMISPWMESGSLATYLYKNNAIDTRSRRIWISQIGSGLQYLHNNGVIHGDLRGHNILLDRNLRAYVADFGLAKLVDAGKSTMGMSTWHPGATRWMPPEVLQGAYCSSAGDIYSFGCVCLEIITGKYPFPHLRTDREVDKWVSEGRRPQWPATGDADLDAIGRIVERCWDHKPDARPQMSDLRELQFPLRPLPLSL